MFLINVSSQSATCQSAFQCLIIIWLIGSCSWIYVEKHPLVVTTALYISYILMVMFGHWQHWITIRVVVWFNPEKRLQWHKHLIFNQNCYISLFMLVLPKPTHTGLRWEPRALHVQQPWISLQCNLLYITSGSNKWFKNNEAHSRTRLRKVFT